MIHENFDEHLTFLNQPLDFRKVLLRSPLEFSVEHLQSFYRNKHVLITGAGTVGTRLLHLFLDIAPAKLTFIDFSEQALHDLNLALSILKPKIPVHSLLLDLMHFPLLSHYLNPQLYDVVIHTAAYKNLPVVEDNIALPIHNNVIATNNLLKLFSSAPPKKFVYVSTDKAVYPKSVMGASKRFTEKVVLNYPLINTTIVRLGNIFGSRGSLIDDLEYRSIETGVIPIFNAGMERYFVSKNEVASLLAFAGTTPQSAVTMVPEMQQPVNILSMVETILELVKPSLDREITIQAGGVRKGEKISEKLFYPEEEKVLTHFSTHKEFCIIPPLSGFDPVALEYHCNLNNVNELIEQLKLFGDFCPDISA